MSEWQWQVILAMIRVIWKLVEGEAEYVHSEDMNLLNDALERDKNYDKP